MKLTNKNKINQEKQTNKNNKYKRSDMNKEQIKNADIKRRGNSLTKH